MSRRNEFKTPTSQFESVSDALKALDNLIKEVNGRKRESEGKCEATRVYRAHVGGLKQCIESVIESSLESWKTLGLDRSFCQKSEKLTKNEYRCVMLFMHPVYEQIWLTDAEGRNVAEEYIPFLEFDLEYIKSTKKLAIGRAVLEKKVHLPELSASYASTQGDLDIIKKETLRLEAIHKAAFDAADQLVDEIGKYSGEQRLDFDGAVNKEVEARKSSGVSIPPKSEKKESGIKAASDDSDNNSSQGAKSDADEQGGDDVLEFIEDVDEEITDINADESEIDNKDSADDKDEIDAAAETNSKKDSNKSTKKAASNTGRFKRTSTKAPLIVPVRPSTQPEAKN